uniref:Uncharacterized protein n=1 Tax=Anguilla anguilla TaxID=7936 RepID=A0A0E9X9J8_ANGAN
MFLLTFCSSAGVSITAGNRTQWSSRPLT